MIDPVAGMTGERWMRVKELTSDALERPEKERPSWLTEACGGDETLRREVESLLAAHARAGDFLETPGVAAGGAAAAVAAAVAAVAHDGSLPVAVGRAIGPYRIVKELGQGGMGVVYVAERADAAFEKKVAVKVVRGGFASGLGARFREERRILATLDHPNIARLLDGGTTADGLPYVVMEYVDGVPLDAYCRTARLSLGQRLVLFAQVCAAVQYAHQHLVIHRDLKAGNILVTADGTPKLLDFGIAKLLDPGLEPTEQTRTALRAFSLEGASPEQVRGDPMTVTSDVYALGVLLYRLLTGESPYGSARRTEADLVRAICEDAPPRPSAAAPFAQRRELRSDVDWILLKALRKEPERRYLTVQELSEDILRHLEGRPVLARADTMAYRLSKFVGRHRASVAAATLAVASLGGGMVTTVRQARIAEANRQRAERRFDEVRNLANFVMFDMHDAIVKLPGATPARKQLVEKALEYLDRLANERVTDPILLAEIARGYERLSRVQGHPQWANLGNHAGALVSIRKAITLREQLTTAVPDDPVRIAELAEGYGALSRILMRQGRTEDGRAALQRMKTALESVPPEHAEDTVVLDAWAVYYGSVAAEQAVKGAFEALHETRRRQVEVAEKLLGREPASSDRQRGLAVAYKYEGRALQALRDWQLARERYQKALELDQKIVEAEPSNPHYKLDLSFDHALMGSLLNDEGDHAGALAAHRKALRLGHEVYAMDADNEFAWERLIGAHQSLAAALAKNGDLAAAVADAREVLKLREQREQKHPSLHGNAAWQASFHSSLGELSELIASRAGTPAPRRREHWRRAREEYSTGLAIWLSIASKKPLEGEYAGNPKRLQDAIKKCDEALAKLRS